MVKSCPKAWSGTPRETRNKNQSNAGRGATGREINKLGFNMSRFGLLPSIHGTK
jgi:hypothetical protein